MQIDFIGHGLNTNNKLNVGDQLATSFGSSHFDCFIGFVAFAAISGVNKLLPSILTAQKKYKKLVFFVGVDNKGTSKEALELLLEKNIETYIYHKDSEQITYHPKLFLFEGGRHTRVIIGSSNLTYSGFLNNIEASIQLDFKTGTDKQGNKLLKEVKSYFANLIDLTDKNVFKLDKDLIEKYDNEGLLYSQIRTGKGSTEEQPNDGENPEEKSVTSPFYTDEFGEGQEPTERTTYERKINVTANDFEVFPFFLERYKIYKRDVRTSGVVYKDTKVPEEMELLVWYQRMKELIKHNALPDDLAMQLIDADFPIENGWINTIRMWWDIKFQKLLEFKEKEQKHLDYTYVIQTKNPESPHYELGRWIAQQKQRRKGQNGSAWTDYEEEKMKSINYMWDVPDFGDFGSKPKDDDWADRLVELEEYYSDKNNFKSIPHQNTKLGKWLNEQITLKLTGTRGKVKKFLHPIREEMLGDVLTKNGVEWKWQEQKEREAIINGLAKWNEWKEWQKTVVGRKLSDEEKKYHKTIQDWVSQTRHRTKKWESWKIDLLFKAGFPLPKKEEITND